jgi:hypothetical protein
MAYIQRSLYTELSLALVTVAVTLYDVYTALYYCRLLRLQAGL